eukprot:symbB.v1.2.028460.t1/scaffold3020.1/size65267/3
MRIGEAGHPGPASRDRSMLLESVPLIEAKTAALQTRFWKWFNQWLDEHLSCSAKNALLAHPATLCQLVKEFGNHLYSTGKTLHVLRHLVVYVQKTFVATRPFMSINWDMIARWEKLEPPIHRTPIPGSILRAMVVIGVLLNWKRFSGVLCLAFFGITRPGEVIRASRKDLVLAGDLLLPDSNVAYLRVGEPKPRGRGKGRVQHASIHEPKVIGFIEHIFGHVHKTDMLYGVSPNTFRRRWNHALQILLVPSEARLTPGSLRGGGAVEAYRYQDGLADCPQDLTKFWASVGDSMLTLYLSITGGLSWEEALRPLQKVNPLAVISLLVYITITIFAVLNVVTGVFCNTAIESARAHKDIAIMKQMHKHEAQVQSLREIFNEIDNGHTSVVSLKQLKEALQSKKLASFMHSMDISTQDIWTLFMVIDANGDGQVTLDEFVFGCMQLQGPAKGLQMARMSYENTMMREEIKRLQYDFRGIKELLKPQTALQRSRSRSQLRELLEHKQSTQPLTTVVCTVDEVSF